MALCIECMIKEVLRGSVHDRGTHQPTISNSHTKVFVYLVCRRAIWATGVWDGCVDRVMRIGFGVDEYMQVIVYAAYPPMLTTPLRGLCWI